MGLYQFREEKSAQNKDLYLFTLGNGKKCFERVNLTKFVRVRDGNAIKLQSCLGYFLIWQGTTKAHSRPTQLRSNAAKSKKSQADCNFILFPSLKNE